MKKPETLIAAGAALLFIILIGASYSNMNSFYVTQQDGALQIERGCFSPTGSKHFITLANVAAPQPMKNVYSRKEIYPLLLAYYIDQADALLKADMPDFGQIKATLEAALPFANTRQNKKLVNDRLSAIDVMVLFYKAEIAASKGDADNLNAALNYLNQADRLIFDDPTLEVLNKKINAIKNRLDLLEQAENGSA